MKNAFVVLLLIAVLGGGAWFALRGTGTPTALAEAEPDGDRYDFEAQQVVMRQMDARGRLQYEVEAERIVQLPDRGAVQATTLTLRHDPPGTVTGGDHRWTLNAAEGELPADGRIVRLKGDVRATGVPQGRTTPIGIRTDSLSIDMDSQVVSTDDKVQLSLGRMNARLDSVSANIATGEIKSLKSGYAVISSRP